MVTQEAMPSIVPGCWLDWGLGSEGDSASRHPETDMWRRMTRFYVTNAHHKVVKLVNRSVAPRTQLCWSSCQRRCSRRDGPIRWQGGKLDPSPRLAT